MKNVLDIVTLASAILLIVSILVQNRGQSLGISFGGDSQAYRSRRGSELVLHNATIVLAIVFVLSIILGIVVKK